jgi:protein-S-isoprenylcysteine O-methyltransferase Ste14
MMMIAVTCCLIGLAGLAALGGFVLLLGLGGLPADNADPGPVPWLIDLGWLLGFALQHSGMARAGFKRWWRQRLPEALERSVYVAASGLATLALVLGWQPIPGDPLWQGPVWLAAVALLAVVFLGWTCLSLDPAGFFGLRQARGRGAEAGGVLQVAGPYRFVRHPLMAGTLVFLWAQPNMPPTLALFGAGMSLYVLVGIWLEERDLVRQLGAAYRNYRQQVPALVPWRWPGRLSGTQ